MATLVYFQYQYQIIKWRRNIRASDDIVSYRGKIPHGDSGHALHQLQVHT
jgi:hypothetical protein